MRRFIVIAAAGLSLAGCSSMSLDAFKPAPPTAQVQLESTPPGVDARTSLGPSCRTPCSVTVTPPDSGFSVTFSQDRMLPVTVPVRVNHVGDNWISSGTVTVDPDPVFAELHPAGPPPRAARKMMRPKKPKPPKAAAAPPAAGSPFPEPAQAPAATR
jgi:hypothetical protein